MKLWSTVSSFEDKDVCEMPCTATDADVNEWKKRYIVIHC